MQTRKGNSNSICSSDHQQHPQPIPARWKLPRAPPSSSLQSPVLGPLIGQTSSARLAAKQNKMQEEERGARTSCRTLCAGCCSWMLLWLPVEAKSGNCNCARIRIWIRIHIRIRKRGREVQAFCSIVFRVAGNEASLMFYLKSSTLYYNGRSSIWLMEWSI